MYLNIPRCWTMKNSSTNIHHTPFIIDSKIFGDVNLGLMAQAFKVDFRV